MPTPGPDVAARLRATAGQAPDCVALAWHDQTTTCGELDVAVLVAGADEAPPGAARWRRPAPHGRGQAPTGSPAWPGALMAPVASARLASTTPVA